MSKYTLLNVTGPDLEALACRLRMALPGTAFVSASERRGTVFCRVGKHRKDDVLDALEDISFGMKATWNMAIIDQYEDIGNTHTISVYRHDGDFCPRSEFELVADHGTIHDNLRGERTQRVIREVHEIPIRSSF